MVVLNMPCHIYEYVLVGKIANVIERTKCDCIALSGGVDTSLIAAVSVNVVKHLPKAFIAYYRGGVPRDLMYALYVAKALGLDVELVEVGDEYVVRVLPLVMKVAGGGHEDYIEVRNDVVFFAVLEKAREVCKCVYVGSGGDELFCGYTFMCRQLLESEIDVRRRAWARGRYPEKVIASLLGVNVVAPYLDDEVVEVALMMPVRCLRTATLRGKEVLRNALESLGLNLIADRVKTPAEAGAGTDVMDQNYFNSIRLRAIRVS